VKGLNLDIREGRSEQAAKLHSVSSSSSTLTTDTAIRPNSHGGDFWAERGERGRWVRTHLKPRTTMFYPDDAPRGPGRKTRLKPMRRVQGIYDNGLRFKKCDDWTQNTGDDELDETWTGNTIFIVDKMHSPDHGTDQRRQRVQSLNQRRVSWSV
jgi:hypothetical protein